MINNRFIIKKKLGEGRSKVFLCSDIDNSGKEYAIKILPGNADENEIKSFRNEFFTLQNLNHPNIITSNEEGTIVKTDGESEISIGSRFIILDYFPGIELLKYDKINDEQVLILILKQVCSVLYYLHQSNYIYYDLKAENILVNETGGEPIIKIIDMGFACHISATDENIIRGTREYIAPEILKKEAYNHQVDLYSLGILLYRIVYGKFPFRTDSELGIYKEHIEREFEYPQTGFSKAFVDIIKKLLKKNPVDRFDNSLQLLKNIGANIEQNSVKHFTPANIFSNRNESLEQIKNYLNDNNKEVTVLRGAEGSGKTALLYKIYSDYEKVILISSIGSHGIGFIQYLLKKIIFNEFVYFNLNKELLNRAEQIFSGKSNEIIEDLRSIITDVSSKIKFTLIIDDFNLLDEFALEIYKELLPITQVNGINLILSERTDHPAAADKIINNMKTVNLSPFTESNLNEYLDKALATFFPKDQLKKLIIKYSDLLPGSVIRFIRDLILLKIIRFTYDGPEVIEVSETDKLLEKSHDKIFRLRFSMLTPDEIKVAQFVSCFEDTPSSEIIAGFNNIAVQTVNDICNKLEEKNIFRISNIENSLGFTSDSIKKYTYSTIRNKESFHIKIAEYITDSYKVYNRKELARHNELGKRFIETYNILIREIEEADSLSAYSYKKNVLDYLLQLPLPSEYQYELKYKLALTYNKLNDAGSTLKLIEELLPVTGDEEKKNELLILKGNSLIELGELKQGKELLKQLIKRINNESRKQKLMVEIAYAEFDMGNYEIATKICNEIIENANSSKENKGKCYNLLGLIDTFRDYNLDNALNNFEKALEMYNEANLKLNVAKMEGNIGNTFNRKEDYLNAEKHWNNSLQINKSIGNLDQEARILLSFGIFCYNTANFEKSKKYYERAFNIFLSLGNRDGQGLVLVNLGETYLSCSEFQKGLNSFKEAKIIFQELNDNEELAEILFMLSKLFYIVGDINRNLTLNEFRMLVDNNNLPERYVNNFKFLSLLHSLNEDNEVDKNDMEKIIKSFIEDNEGGFLAEGLIILANTMIKKGNYEIPYTLMNESKFEKICDKNYLYMAERKYLFSSIASVNSSFGLPPAIKSLEEAYNLISEEQITELTWKILFSLGKNYFTRGNFKKSKEFLLYSKKVIHFIAENIIEKSLREEYLSKPERKTVLEEIENMIQKN